MSETHHKPEVGNEADDSQGADTRLLFARILERLDRLEKKLDAALAGRERNRQWGGENRRPGGFNRPFQPNGYGQHRPGGNRFEGPRGHRPHQSHGGKPFQGHRPQTPR